MVRKRKREGIRRETRERKLTTTLTITALARTTGKKTREKLKNK